MSEEILNSTSDENTEPFADVSNKAVRATLQHQMHRDLNSFIKQFSENRFINPDKLKDIDDVIRVYWGLQDMSICKNYFINPMHQQIDKLFKDNPALIKKLYYCRTHFAKQHKKYTESVRAIVQFGKYSLFTSEYDANAMSPILNEKFSWGQTSGMSDKQLCIVIAAQDANWIKTIASPVDKAYIMGIQKVFGALAASDNVTVATAKAGVTINKSQLFRDRTYTNRLVGRDTQESNGVNNSVFVDKYDVIFGDPFAEDDGSMAPAEVQVMYGYRRTNKKKGKQGPADDDTVHTGLVSRYGLIDGWAFDKKFYETALDEYVKSTLVRDDNPELFNVVWNRFGMGYQQLLQAMVDRAIISVHQTMVEYLISVYEQKFSIPQLMMYYSPGTMIKVKTDYDIFQCAMVLGTSIEQPTGELALTIKVLNPNTTKVENVMVHDIYNVANASLVKSKPSYQVGLVSSGTRSGSIFNYYGTSSSVELMQDADIEQQLVYSLKCLQMAIKPRHMQMDANYAYSEWKYGQKESNQVPYNGRLMVDYEFTRSGFTDFDKNAITYTHSLADVCEQATLEHYKKKITYPGGIDASDKTGSVITLTGDKFLEDIRAMLSLPVVASAYMLKDKRWGLVKVTDLEEVKYNKNVFDKLVLNNKHKQFIKINAEFQNRNTFKDLINGKESGCVFLLSGSPGVGKTLTAEAIAEELQKPLYQITCGELGSWEGAIENELSKLFDRAQKWDAIVLIDEADVFLYKRTDGDIDRNAVVSTFLRQIEYFKGVLFLTTNRADDIDEAFKTRILQTFQFPGFTTEQRQKVWAALMAKQGVELKPAELKELAKYELNGREIKNVIKASIAMSIFTQKDLSYDIIMETAKTMRDADEEASCTPVDKKKISSTK